ncbi:YcaO-like family protein [Mesorhizobium huakuii]|uniref:YcaO-like family protein n=1 Tax=Mesorhizobium huakuii TaxID=28104 RepID=A0ABZ0W094_9HYPH|nr:YcaO-like family protein [Mesorhizobium huakuii]WQC02568.1 YcaO-like family protein [Mesorhizobium huakuii]
MLLQGPHWIKLASLPQRDQLITLIQDGITGGPRSSAHDLDVLANLAATLVASPANGLPLLRFAIRYEIGVEVFNVPGGFLAMSNIAPFEGSEERVTASGKGFDAARAVLACLGEAAEISSWACRADDVTASTHIACPSVGMRVDAIDVLGFSQEQIRNRARLNRAWHGWDAIPPSDHLKNPRLWSRVVSFHDDRTALCPAFLCYGRLGDVAYDDASLNVDSNGCAAGTTRADARTRALLELVERDATGIWWHRGSLRTRLDVAQLNDQGLRSYIRQHRRDTGRRLWLLDISSFRTAMVVAAISCEDTGERMAVGFGAGFHLVNAARSAFLELIQSEATMHAHAERAERLCDAVPSDHDCRMDRWKRFADIRNFRFAIGEPAAGLENSGTGNVDDLLDEIDEVCGQQVWFANLSRSEIGIPVAKAICEGLSHFKVRWGCPRNTAPSLAAGSSRIVSGLSQARKLLI